MLGKDSTTWAASPVPVLSLKEPSHSWCLKGFPPCLSAQNLSLGLGAVSYLLLGATQNSTSLHPHIPSLEAALGYLIQPKCHPSAPPPPFLALKDKGPALWALPWPCPEQGLQAPLLIRTQANSPELVDTLEGKGAQEKERAAQSFNLKWRIVHSSSALSPASWKVPPFHRASVSLSVK